MKKLFFLIFFSIGLKADFFDYLPFSFNQEKKAKKIFLTPGVQEKQHLLTLLQKEKEQLESSQKQFLDNNQEDLNSLNKKIEEIKSNLKDSENNDFYNKILAKLNEISQFLIDSQLKRKKLIATLDEHIEILEKYLQDPSFKEKIFESRSSYDFDCLDKIYKDIYDFENEIQTLSEQKSTLEQQLDSLKKELNSVDKELRIKEKEQKKFSNKLKDESEKNSLSLKAKLLDVDIKYLTAQKKLVELKIKDLQLNINLLSSKLFISDSILKLLKSNVIAIERSLWINEADLDKINQELNDKRRTSTELQAKYAEDIRRLSQDKDKYRNEFDKLSKQNKVPDLKALTDWSLDNKSFEEIGIFELGYLNSRMQTYERAVSLKESLRDYQREFVKSEEILSNIIDFWYKFSQRKFNTEEEIESEKKKFELFRDDLNKDLNFYKEKINSINNFINGQARSHNNILDKIKYINEKRESFISKFGKEVFDKLMLLISRAEEQIRIQNDFNNKIIENYSNITNLIKDSQQKINIILSKVENFSAILLRSKYAISLKSINNVVPQLKLYSANLIKSFSNKYTKTNLSFNFSSIFQLILLILVLVLLFSFLKKFLPYFYQLLLSIKTSLPGTNFINYTFATVINFINTHLFSIYIWSIIFILVKFNFISNVGIKAFFYLLSIPFLCYLADRFINYLLLFNASHNNAILNPSFQKRFVYVYYFFIYSTIIIFSFIESFNLVIHNKSDLTIILLAIYSVIVRASLIFLIGKEEILSLIPQKGPASKWIRVFIDKLYYYILTGIIFIMLISDPYIGGFNKLFSFILWGSIYSILLIISIWWLQVLLRKISSTIFFKKEEDEAAKERFVYAKTFYGVFSVVSFLFFLLMAIFIGAKIWHLPISLEKFWEFLNVTIFSVKGDADQVIPITLKSFVILFSFLFVGFIIAWAFDRFIIRRIFDILLVDQGVQNTVSNITYYFIIIIILLVGLLRIGLSGLIPFVVGAMAVGIAFAIKGPANDFIGYFVLLVERSVKIGDYIEINDEKKGVVRKITPRSVVLRKKNSVNVIVPNSELTNSVFYNWNYTPGFTAIDDIKLTIPFDTDPKEISALLQKTVSENSNILKSPAPIVLLEEFSQNGYIFMIRGFISFINVLNKWQIASDIRIAVVKALREKNIQISPTIHHVYVNNKNELQL